MSTRTRTEPEKLREEIRQLCQKYALGDIGERKFQPALAKATVNLYQATVEIATDVKTKQARKPVSIVRETPVSAVIDGGNNIGYVAAYRGAEVAIKKAKASGMATVGGFNTYYSGRNAYFVEKIGREGLVASHTSAASPRVLPPGAAKPMLGTNPICFGFPSTNGPVVVDMGTASFMWGEVMLHAHLGEPLPAGVGFDEQGRPSTDGRAVLKGGVAPFGGATRVTACLSRSRHWAYSPAHISPKSDSMRRARAQSSPWRTMEE